MTCSRTRALVTTALTGRARVRTQRPRRPSLVRIVAVTQEDTPDSRSVARTPRGIGQWRTWLPRGDLAVEALGLIAILAVALVLRTVDLSGLPPGLNGDEAATGLDARKIFAGHGVWPYTNAALGQPAGPMYWSAIWVKLLGSNIFAVRLPMALLGAGSSLLAFFAFRELFGRPVA